MDLRRKELITNIISGVLGGLIVLISTLFIDLPQSRAEIKFKKINTKLGEIELQQNVMLYSLGIRNDSIFYYHQIIIREKESFDIWTASVNRDLERLGKNDSIKRNNLLKEIEDKESKHRAVVQEVREEIAKLNSRFKGLDSLKFLVQIQKFQNSIYQLKLEGRVAIKNLDSLNNWEIGAIIIDKNGWYIINTDTIY
jgi:hypothetical protein